VSERTPTDVIDLERRVAPRQKRSLARSREIIEATERLLARADVETITTSLVAAEADVPVSSVYRYFPNIHSIHRTIFEEFKADSDLIVGRILSDPEYQDWRESLRSMMIGLRRLIQKKPSYRAVFRLIRTTHELRSVRDDWNTRLSNVLAARWHAGLDGFRDGNPDLVARMTVEIYCAAEIVAFEQGAEPSQADAFFNEALVALEHYLAHYLD
jgi:AcrR family transcriptional regulator